MKKQLLMVAVLFCAVSLPATGALAIDQEQVRERAQTQEQIYGSQMMTEQERLEYRARIRAAETDEERARIRNEHHQRMQERAKARGMTLPDEPPGQGGMGMGNGPGGGMGSGGGMRPGGGMGPGGGRGR